MADEVVRSFNGKHDRLWNKTDLYSSYRQAQAYKSERDKLDTEVRRLKTEVSTLSKSLKGVIPHRGGKSPVRTPPRRKNKEGNSAFFEDRRDVRVSHLNWPLLILYIQVCRDWNRTEGCTRTTCKFLHICNAKASSGKCCKSKNHKGPEQK